MTPRHGEKRFGRNLLWRVVAAALFIPAFLWISRLGGVPFLIYVEMLILLGAREFFAMAGPEGDPAGRGIGVALALGWGVLFHAWPGAAGEASLAYLALILFVLLFRWLAARPESGSLPDTGRILIGVLYVGFLFAHQVLLRERPVMEGAGEAAAWRLLLFPYVVVWMADTSAYFVGKTLGRHRLAPAISPGKSVEGALGGCAGALAVAAAWPAVAGGAPSGRDALILGLIVAIVSQLGDLLESRLKRESGVKDSSAAIPGHGGILDRYDGILVAVPVAYYYLFGIAPPGAGP